jgi:chromosome segregation ATPase
VARIKGLSASLNTATEKAAVAEARLKAMQSGGQGSAPGADDPTLANMEARASQIAEEIRQMERTYTPEFMRMDPRAKSLQSRLVEMERQIEAQRAASRQAALGAAQDEVASARATIERLQAEIRAQRSTMQNFSQRFTQAKALEDDLAQIERPAGKPRSVWPSWRPASRAACPP